MQPSAYEKRALAEIHAWKHPTKGWLAKVIDVVTWPLDKAGDLALELPGVGWVLEKSIGGLVGLLNDAAQWSVRHDAIHDEYRDDGHQVHRHEDVYALDLKKVDQTVGMLATKYKALAAAEGAATGAGGVIGIPVDIVAIVTLNLRAIGEYATYYGFDVRLQQERLFAINILGLASSPNDAAKTAAMAQLVRIARDVAAKKTWKNLEKHAFVQVLQQIAKALGLRLTKAKLAQIVPLAGAAVGLGFNAWFTANVCEAAQMLYRERFLAEKYGPAIVEVVTPPAKSVDPRYPEEDAVLPTDVTPPSVAAAKPRRALTAKPRAKKKAARKGGKLAVARTAARNSSPTERRGKKRPA